MARDLGLKRLCRALLVCASCAVAASANAQPAITGVSGTVTNNQTVSITGSGFGTKATAAPLVWEDFNDGVLHPSLSPHGSLPLTNTDNLRHAFSTRNARANYKVAGANGDGHYFEYNGGTALKWFVQYWIKLASNWRFGTTAFGGGDDGLANIKFFRMFPSGSRTYTNVGYSLHGFAGGAVMRFVERGAQPYLDVDGRQWFTPGTWHNVQVEFGDGGLDQPNGSMKLWVDGVLRDSATSLITNVGSDGPAVAKRPYVIGFYDSWAPSDAAVSNMYAYYSDIYVDNSWARVELGNAATYAACTRREMLLPSAWSATGISARVAQGAFTSGQTAYVYVVDSTGRVNSAGYRVTVGGTATTTRPAAPTGLRIVR